MFRLSRTLSFKKLSFLLNRISLKQLPILSYPVGR
ncbi:hypothetical protein ChUKH1_04740 [Cryptosporidium hominis]|nr:hypothetical protein ChUKH1_04740 [Cryptosporidium hominis]